MGHHRRQLAVGRQEPKYGCTECEQSCRDIKPFFHGCYFLRRRWGLGLGLRIVVLWMPFLGFGGAFIAFLARETFFAFATSASRVELRNLTLTSSAKQPTRAFIPAFC